MSAPTLPMYITYAPTRIAGKWRMHETVGNLRNSIRNNSHNWRGASAVEAIFRLNANGTWDELTIPEVMDPSFKG